MSAPSPPAGETASPPSPHSIVHRHAHEVRNHLNGLGLLAALLDEKMDHVELADTVRRLRVHLAQLDGTVTALLLKFDAPRPVALDAGDLLSLWQMKLKYYGVEESAIQWSRGHGSLSLNLDAKAVVLVLCDLTLAALRRFPGGPLQSSLRMEAGTAVLTLQEPSGEMALPAELIGEARQILGTQGGTLEHQQLPATRGWLTTLTFAAA